MHTLDIQELNKRFNIPENLSECDRRQYLDMAKLIFMFQNEEITYEQFRILALYSLMNMHYQESELPNMQEEKWQEIYIISEILDSFFTEDEEGIKHLVQYYIHNTVKTVKYKMLSFTGPKDGFEDITWTQLIEGIGLLQSFQDSRDPAILLKLFAMFYLRKGEKFGKIDLDKRMEFFKDLDIRYVYGFFLLFTSFWKFLLSDAIIKVDGREINLSKLFEKDEDSEESEAAAALDLPELGLRSTAFQLAESGVFGSMDELEQSNAWKVLLRIYDMMVRNKKREAEQKDQENKSE